MSETMKVFVACALGAFIGTLVSLEINRYFWWLGLLAGGFVGYISYEFKKVVSAIPKAWRKARGWQPDREWWREYGKLFVTVVNSGFVVVLPLGFLLEWLLMGPSRFPETSLFELSFLFGLTSLLLWVLFIMGIGSISTRDAREVNELVRAPFFLKVYFWLLPKWTLKGGWWLLRKSPAFFRESTRAIAEAVRVVSDFLVYLFREVHSDIRMLCGLDAAIGTVIGYFAGSAIIGAVAGGLWGALNFEILSIRVLKLVPIEKSLFR